jgi:tellurite resistance protein TerC
MNVEIWVWLITIGAFSVAIGFTDLLFALDSIPAFYDLTNEPYIVFIANAFALLGLRQLSLLLSGLMQPLRYLGFGLSLVLAWYWLGLESSW